MICAYLSAALLVGLLASVLLGWCWADPAGALVIAAVAVREGIESWRAEDYVHCVGRTVAPAAAARVGSLEQCPGHRT